MFLRSRRPFLRVEGGSTVMVLSIPSDIDLCPPWRPFCQGMGLINIIFLILYGGGGRGLRWGAWRISELPQLS
jgi:hypothetical protein